LSKLQEKVVFCFVHEYNFESLNERLPYKITFIFISSNSLDYRNKFFHLNFWLCPKVTGYKIGKKEQGNVGAALKI